MKLFHEYHGGRAIFINPVHVIWVTQRSSFTEIGASYRTFSVQEPLDHVIKELTS